MRKKISFADVSINLLAITFLTVAFAGTSTAQKPDFTDGAECSWATVYPLHVEYASILDSDGSTIILSRRSKFFITHDGGALWEPHSEIDPNYLVRQIISFDKCGEGLLINAVSSHKIGKLFLTHNGGLTYKNVLDNSGIGESMFFSTDTSLIACATSHPFGIWISKDRGETWDCHTTETSDTSFIPCSIQGIAANGHLRIIVGCNPPMLLITDDTGKSFKHDSVGYYGGLGEVPQIAEGVDTTELYACIAFGGNTGMGSIFRSTNSGETWQKMKSPTSLWSVLPDRKKPGHLWAGQYFSLDTNYPPSSILTTNDYGKTWQDCGGHDGSFNWMLRFTPDHRAIILASEKGLFKSVLKELSLKDPDNH